MKKITILLIFCTISSVSSAMCRSINELQCVEGDYISAKNFLDTPYETVTVTSVKNPKQLGVGSRADWILHNNSKSASERRD